MLVHARQRAEQARRRREGNVPFRFVAHDPQRALDTRKRDRLPEQTGLPVPGSPVMNAAAGSPTAPRADDVCELRKLVCPADERRHSFGE